MSNKPEVEDALALCQSILDDADEMPEAAEDFTAGVTETTESIMEDIEARDRVTPNQLRALCNMRDGMDSWLRRRRR